MGFRGPQAVGSSRPLDEGEVAKDIYALARSPGLPLAEV